jgi:hypothetical protein
METHGWLFELCGDEYDLQTLVELFGEAFSIKEIDGNWCLTTQLPYSSEASTDAWAVVGAILAELNASAQVAYGNHQNVRLGAMACWDRPGAPPTQIVGPASARSRRRCGGGGLVAHRLLCCSPEGRQFQTGALPLRRAAAGLERFVHGV